MQVTSASSCERNWSAFGFIHSKSRNRLSSKKAEELVYVFSNRRLLRRGQSYKPRFVQWAEEEADPDVSDMDELEEMME